MVSNYNSVSYIMVVHVGTRGTFNAYLSLRHRDSQAARLSVLHFHPSI